MDAIEASSVNPNEKWRNYTRSSFIPSCKISKEDIKELYRVFQEKQNAELESTISNELHQQPEETQDAFESRKQNVRNAFLTKIDIKKVNGETITGHGENFLESLQTEGRIVSITFDTRFSPKALLNFTPRNLAEIVLDFSQPTLTDFSAHPSSPTPNSSEWFIMGNNEAWVTSLSTRIKEFFEQRKTNIDWLHRPAAYDKLLILIGIPLCLWGTMHIGASLLSPSLNETIKIASYIYIFIACANIFRSMFAYAKWIFPKIELESTTSRVGLHRFVWFAITVSVTGAAIYDLIIYLLLNNS